MSSPSFRDAHRWRLAAGLVVFALIPVALLDDAAVPSNPLDGLPGPAEAWLLILPVSLAAVLRRPLAARVVRDFAPYGVFLVLATISLVWTPEPAEGTGTLLRLLAPALVYLAVRAGDGEGRAVRTAGGLAGWWIGLTAAAYVAGRLLDGYRFPDRLAAMSLAALFAAATLQARSRTAALALGGTALAVSLATGSRTATLVILLLVLASPVVALAWRTRVLALTAAVLAFAVALTFPAFQARWFTDTPGTDAGSIADVVTFGDNLDTSGRRAVWAELAAVCGDAPLFGKGLGASNAIGQAVGEGFSQPHNDYLRIFCDTGLAGTVLLWSFFVAVGWRAWRTLRISGAPRTVPAAALALLAGLAMLAATDNVLTATLQYAAPAAVVFGWSDRQAAAWVVPRLRPARLRVGGRR